MSHEQTVSAQPATSEQTSSSLSWATPGRVALLVGAITLIIYFLTMNRTFGFVDKGELVAVASTLGISHPTGYPTIMMLGWLFTMILPVREVLALNIMSALLTACGTAVMALLLNDLLGRIALKPRSQTKGKKKAKEETRASEQSLDPGERALYAGLGALLMGFTSIWWNQGNGFEVYSLHALMIPLVTLFFLRWVDEEKRLQRTTTTGESAPLFTRQGALFALMLGLSFTNHLTTILLAPAFLVYYFWTMGSERTGKSVPGIDVALLRLLPLGIPFIAGLLPYLYLPIRASMNPRFNWGDPDSIDRFVNHIAGKQYQTWMFAGMEVFKQQASFFFGNLPAEVGYLGLLLVVLGVIMLASRSLRLSVAVAFLFLFCIFWSSTYDIMEIGPYYMVAIFALGIWCAAGILWLHERFGRTAAMAAGALVVALTMATNYSASNESPNTLVEDMTYNMLHTLPNDALVFSQQWDFWVAGSFYMQGVEKMRPDVLVIDHELLRRSWYLDELSHTYPPFMERVKPEVDRFREQVYKFEHDLPYDGATIDAAYYGMINAMVDKNIAERPVLVTGEVPVVIGGRYRRVPNHLTLRLTQDTLSYLPEEFPTYRFSIWPGRVDGYVAKLYELYANSAYARALYERAYGNDSLATRYLDYALSFDPGFSEDKIPALPLNSEEQVTGMIGFFDQLRALRGGSR